MKGFEAINFLGTIRPKDKLKEIIFTHAGGMRGDAPLKAVIPGGSSTPPLTPADIEVKMDFESLKAADTKKPYGDAPCADPGYQADGKKRYPLRDLISCGKVADLLR